MAKGLARGRFTRSNRSRENSNRFTAAYLLGWRGYGGTGNLRQAGNTNGPQMTQVGARMKSDKTEF